MKKYIICIILLLGILPVSAQDRAIEIKGDRTIIYPQMMGLSHDETLLDLLLYYPEMLVAGFNDLLNNMEPGKSSIVNAGYQLRMDNVPMSGNIRILLGTIKAKDVQQVQIYDNPDIAKGIGELKGVIDINMLRPQDGTHGSVEIQAATDGLITPIANVRHGSEKYDLYAVASYDRPTVEPYVYASNTYIFAEMAARLSGKDKLLSYFNVQQSNQTADNPATTLYKNNSTQELSARFRWFHTFNDDGTELQTLIGFQFQKTPQTYMTTMTDFYRSQEAVTKKPMVQVELNTPLIQDNLSMKLGWECNYDMIDYTLRQNYKTGGYNAFDRTSKYNIINNDAYIQLNYTWSIFHITLGDRIQFAHYGMDSPVAGQWSRNTIRNMWQASIVATPFKKHQVQLAYNRRLINPSYLEVIPEAFPGISAIYTIGSTKLNEAEADIFKFAYGYTDKGFTMKAGTSFIHAGNYITPTAMVQNVNTWTNIGQTDTWKAEGSASYTWKDLTVTGGANYYNMKVKGMKNRIYFGTARLKASYTYLQSWNFSAMGIFSTFQSPIRQAHNNRRIYAEAMIAKSIDKNLKVSLMWHDIFESQNSACLGSLSYTF